jgi:predicted  nucleic acid-binding Zn-ribbon protein
MSENINGVTYYGLTSEYDGDVTKGCGLTAAEIDSNFHFLRGKEIVSLNWDEEENLFTIKLLNGDIIKSDSVTGYIDRTIEEALSAVTEDVEVLKCQVSGLSESIGGIYDEIDIKMNEFREEFGVFKRNIEQEMIDRDEQIVLEFNTKIEELTDIISGIINRIENDEARITALERGVESAVDDLRSELEPKINANTQAINNLSAATDQRFEQVTTTFDEKIAQQNCTISSLSDRDDALSDRIDAVENDFSGLSQETHAALDEQMQIVIEASNKVNRLSADTNSNFIVVNNSINGVNDKVEQLSGETSVAIGAINGRIDDVEGDVDSVSSRVSNVVSSVSQLAGTMSDAIDGVNERIDNVVSQLSGGTSEAVSELNDRIDTLNGRIDDVAADLDGVENTIGDTSALSGNTVIEYIDIVASSAASGMTTNLKFTGDDLEV